MAPAVIATVCLSVLKLDRAPMLTDWFPQQGEHLRDNYEVGVHINASVPWDNTPYEGCGAPLNGTEEDDPCLQQWFEGYGPYGEGSAPVYMLLRTDFAPTEDADVIVFGGTGISFTGHYPGFSRDSFINLNSLSFAIVLMHSEEQSGFVRLKSSNPREQPRIHIDFYPGEAGERDVRILKQALERVMEFSEMTGEPFEPFEYIAPHLDISLEQNILDHTWVHHATSSCRMGPAGDKNYCVDSKFRVNGVEGLRIVDGSVFPISPGGFPASSTLLAGRKATHDILADAAKA